MPGRRCAVPGSTAVVLARLGATDGSAPHPFIRVADTIRARSHLGAAPLPEPGRPGIPAR